LKFSLQGNKKIENIIIFLWKYTVYICVHIHEKNGFAERSKILAGYRSENNFVVLSK